MSNPIRREERICFGVEWYATEKEAMEVDEVVQKNGEVYNGGYMHNHPCGRRPEFDCIRDNEKQFAVTRR